MGIETLTLIVTLTLTTSYLFLLIPMVNSVRYVCKLVRPRDVQLQFPCGECGTDSEAGLVHLQVMLCGQPHYSFAVSCAFWCIIA